MPEARESLSSCEYLLDWLISCFGKDKTLLILDALLADATERESRAGLATDGLVFELDAHCQLTRGGNFKKGEQRALEKVIKKAKGNGKKRSLIEAEEEDGTGFEIDELEVSGYEGQVEDQEIQDLEEEFDHAELDKEELDSNDLRPYSARYKKRLKIFSRKDWEYSVRIVPRKERKYRVGLALQFKEHVVAFISHDLVFLPTWRSTFDELKETKPDVYLEYDKFLLNVANWMRFQYRMKKRADGHSPRPQLASRVVRETNQVWLGVGVYTVSEIFYMAGLSPFLTEEEVFDSPSRVARLCDALWAYNHKSHTEIKALLKKSCINGVLAPTTEHRLAYKDWLFVYGKLRTRNTPRMSDLIRKYTSKLQHYEASSGEWFRLGENAVILFDPFEPNCIKSALHADISKKPNLGHLIFGSQEWQRLSGTSEIAPANDPLTKYFKSRGLMGSTTHLDVQIYDTLFSECSDPQLRKSFWQYNKTYAYSADKQIWSAVPNFPSNSRISSKTSLSKTTITQFDEKERQESTFEYIVTRTQQVAIGPLEYCGNARIIKAPHGKKQLAIAGPYDPQLSMQYITRNVKSAFRRKAKLGEKGKSKTGMTDVQKRALAKEIKQVTDTHLYRTRSLSSNASDFDSAESGIMDTLSALSDAGDSASHEAESNAKHAPPPPPNKRPCLTRLSFDKRLAMLGNMEEEQKEIEHLSRNVQPILQNNIP